MSVKVRTSRFNSLGDAIDNTHEKGDDFNVQDGHLVVLGRDSQEYIIKVAVYAPGAWAAAEVS